MKRLRRLVTVGTAVTALALSGLVWGSVAAQAARAACGTKTYSFAGMATGDLPTDTAEGIQAYVPVRSSNLCTSVMDGGNFSTSWVMVSPKSSSTANNNNWAQSGQMFDFVRSCHYYFSQTNYNGVGAEWDSAGCASVGVTNRFWVYYNTSCSCFHTGYDSVSSIVTSWNPKAAGSPWVRPWSLWASGEAPYSIGSDIPGDPSLRTTYSAIGYQQWSTHLFVSACLNNPNGLLHSFLYWNAPGTSRYAAQRTACDQGWSETLTP